MEKVHKRTDIDFVIVKGEGRFCRAAYACVLTQATYRDDTRSIYHVEIFYGNDGRKVRAAAVRYGSAIKRGYRGVCGYRSTHLPSIFPPVPYPREDEIPL